MKVRIYIYIYIYIFIYIYIYVYIYVYIVECSVLGLEQKVLASSPEIESTLVLETKDEK